MVQSFQIPGATRDRPAGDLRRHEAPTVVLGARAELHPHVRSATVEVVDNLPPAVQILPDTPLATGAWVRGTQPLNYTASDNVGVQARRGDHRRRGASGCTTRACVLATPTGPFADPLPCPNGPGQIALRTSDLLEGTQPVVVEAQDAAGNSAVSSAVTARIDNTPPPRVDVSVEGGEAWRNRNDFSSVWTNPAEGDRAPITAANYQLCAGGTANCSRGTHEELNVSRLPVAVPRPGEWTLSIWRRDAAGNAEEDNASVPVTLRYDPEPPQLAFEPQQAADPTHVAVRVTDQVSGVADGVIEIGAAGSGVWHTLPTQKDGNRLVSAR